MLAPRRQLARRWSCGWVRLAGMGVSLFIMVPNSLAAPRTLVWWILFCAFWNCTGWILSALHFLNATGYSVALLVGIGLALSFRRLLFSGLVPARAWRKAGRRFRRPIPLAFLILAAVAFTGGVMYAPNNYDALAYRLPRVLHWLAEGRWHWIHTEFQRVNARGCGVEWVVSPILLFTGTDRFLFLLSFASFCFLPGLLFSIFRRLGVAPRTAWAWMWLLPTGYGFLLQAGSIANDLFATTLVFAAVSFALRANQQKSPGDLWLSLVAAGLFTAVKANNLPLLLVCAVIIAPCWKLALSRPATLAGIGAIVLCASFLPTAFLNVRHSGDWTGAKAEQFQFSPPNLWARPIGNLGRMALDSFLPPINPFTKTWNESVADKLVPASIKPALIETFMPEGPMLRASELKTEEGAGLGLGVCVLLVVSFVAALSATGSRRPQTSRITQLTAWVMVASLIAFAAFLQASFVESTPRLAMAYYPFLALPLLLHPGQTDVVRKRWWSGAALVVCVLALAVVILTPARPLFPINTTLASLERLGAPPKLLARAKKVYAIYGARAHAFDRAIELLPLDTKVLGIVTFDDPEAALWQPFGSRRVVHVCSGDSSAMLRAEGLRYILVKPEAYAKVFHAPFDEWLKELNGEVIQSVSLPLRAATTPLPWQLIHLR